MRREARSICPWFATAIGLALAAAARAGGMFEGELDPGFYFDGRITLDLTVGDQVVHDLAVAPDGRIVAVGSRWNPSGQSTLFWTVLDGTSAPIECSPVDLAGGLFANARSVTFDALGRLVLAGSASFPSTGYEGIAARYLYPDCDLDETFNLDGVFRTDYSGESAGFQALGFDSLQRLVLAGQLSGGTSAILARLTSNGLYDFGFDSDGHLELALGTGIVVRDLVVQDDDRILFAGEIDHATQATNFLAVRVDPLGDLDGTFSGDGIAQVDFGGIDVAHDLAIDPLDGGVLIAGESGIAGPAIVAAVARLTSTGGLDSGFGGGDGRWSHTVADDTWLRSLELQSDGKLLVAGGLADEDTDADLVVYRLTRAGAIDGSFGFLGALAVSFDVGGSLDDEARGSVLQGGKLLLGGSAATSTTAVGAVARLWISLVFSDGFERGSAGGWSAAAP